MADKIPDKRSSSIHSVLDKPEIQQQIKHKSNKSNIKEVPPEKHSLQAVIDAMIKAGYNHQAIVKALNDIIFLYEGKRVEKFDVVREASNILSKKNRFGWSLTDQVRDFINTTEGEFSLRDVAENIGILKERGERNKLSTIMCRLLDEKLVERSGKLNGIFRRIDKDLNEMNFISAVDEEADIWLPFGLSDLCSLENGSIFLVMGEPNSGKTAIALNLIRYNMDRYHVHYFNSEMGGSELKKRLKGFDDIPISDWCFRAYERYENFEDVIVPGQGNINIIDYVELHDEFWKIGGILKKIHERLKGSIGVVMIQKDPQKEFGRGGSANLEKPRLAIAVAPGFTKIMKAKAWKGDVNPNGMAIKWEINAGCWFHTKGDWQFYKKGGK